MWKFPSCFRSQDDTHVLKQLRGKKKKTGVDTEDGVKTNDKEVKRTDYHYSSDSG